MPVQQRRSPIRGRDEDVAALGEQLALLQSGRGSITVVRGAPGIGKTRMLQEAAAAAGRVGARARLNASAPDDDGVPMGALMGALFGGADPLLELAALPDLSAAPERRFWLLRELEELLAAAADEGPLAVLLDDVHWADAASASAVEALSGRLAGRPIAWVLAARAAEAPLPVQRALARLASAPSAVALTLGPLDAGAAVALTRDLAGGDPDPDLRALAADAHGVPFWISELLLGLGEEGLLSVQDGVARRRAPRLPERVAASMRERLTRTSPRARGVVAVAAVLGGHCTIEHLGLMLKLDAYDLVGPVGELLAAGLLAEDGDGLGFRHDVLRTAVLETLPASARAALDRQAARVLTQTGTPPVEVATRIAADARPGDAEAIDLLLAAARSLGPADADHAAGLLARTLDLLAPGDERRAAVVGEVVVLLHAAGRGERAAAFADGALRDLLPATQEAEVQYRIAGLLSLSGDVRVAAGRRALALPGLPARERARHRARLVHNLVSAGRLDEARPLLASAGDEARASGDAVAAFSLRLAAGGLRHAEGDYATALEEFEAGAREGSGSAEGARAWVAQQWRAEALAALDRADEAAAVRESGLAAARRERQTWAIRWWEQWRGREHHQRGEHRAAVAALEPLFEPGEDHLHLAALDGAALSALAGAALQLGDSRLERRCAAIATAMFREGPPEVRRHCAWVLARLAFAAGDAQGARDRLAGPGAVLPTLPADVADDPQLVRLALAAGDRGLAERAVATAVARAERNPGVASIAGAAAHARGLLEDDPALLRAAVAALEDGARPPALASALEDLGVAAARAGDQDTAVDALGRALDLLVATGATTGVARVRRRLRAQGVTRRAAMVVRPETGWASLTESELSVVRAITRGMTNREAAEHLVLSPHTINSHLRHIFGKLDINSRVALTHLAARHETAVPA